MPWPPKDGEYYATNTLLGSYEYDPATGEGRAIDCNRRQIYRWPEPTVLFYLNDEFKEWTPEDEAALKRRLAELNAKNQETT